jgi:hypothetical protein
LKATLKSLRRLAVSHRTATILIAAMFPILLRLCLLPYLPIPEPEIHDEFSYLLGADTFASGRLTNPPHPMWVHFETFHVNQQPTYATKYPPAQPLFLAFGQRFLGNPWYGVLLSIGFMCGCICWMLQGWMSPFYALIGALVAATQYGVASYWVNSYWGGALPAAGGALVLGVLPRILRHRRACYGIAGALGIVLLAFSRPFEGLVLTVTAGAVLLWRLRRGGQSIGALMVPRLVIPACAVFVVAFSWMGYYNYRVTGNPWLMPYAVNQRTYAASPHFWLLPAGEPPVYRHEIIRKLWAEWDRGVYFEARAHPFWLPLQLIVILLYPLSTPLRVSLLTGIVLPRTRKVRMALVIAGALMFALLMEKAYQPHYFAPAMPLVILLIVAGWRYMLRMARAQSATLQKAVGVLLAGSVLVSYGYDITDYVHNPPPHSFANQRSAIIKQLSGSDSRHVVIVRYTPNHDIHRDFVQNLADIDGSSVIWARDMGEDGNRDLLEYYRDRKIWLLEADLGTPRLTEYVNPAVKISRQ